MVQFSAPAVSPHDVSLGNGDVPNSLLGVRSRAGRRMRNLVVDVVTSPKLCGNSPWASPTELQVDFGTDAANVGQRRRASLTLQTPSSCTSTKSKAFSAFDYQPSERSVVAFDCGHSPTSIAGPSPAADAGPSPATIRSARKCHHISVMTPRSCISTGYRSMMSPRTPDPVRGDLRLLVGDVRCILFDFDGTLTATPGHLAGRHSQKTAELCDRATMLAPYLKTLKDADILLGIISKSTETTVRNSLQAAGLSDVFLGPILGKAVGLEGKVGFIEDLAVSGALGNLGSGDHDECLSHILLVDDDVRELDRARVRGVQTFPAPAEGGLQDDDFFQIFAHIELAIPDMLAARTSAP